MTEPESSESGSEDEVAADDTEGEAEADETEEHYVRPVDKMKRSAGGAAIAAAMSGLHDVFYGPKEKEEVAVVTPAPGKPVDPEDPIELHLDAEHPKRSVVYVHLPPPAETDPPGSQD